MADDTKKKGIKEKIKTEIQRFKEKKKRVEGDVKIPGVSKPRKHKYTNAKLKNQRQRRDLEAHKQVVVGPRGGKYVRTKSGKMRPAKRKEGETTSRGVAASRRLHSVKKAVEDIVTKWDSMDTFIQGFKNKK